MATLDIFAALWYEICSLFSLRESSMSRSDDLKTLFNANFLLHVLWCPWARHHPSSLPICVYDIGMRVCACKYDSAVARNSVKSSYLPHRLFYKLFIGFLASLLFAFSLKLQFALVITQGMSIKNLNMKLKGERKITHACKTIWINDIIKVTKLKLHSVHSCC